MVVPGDTPDYRTKAPRLLVLISSGAMKVICRHAVPNENNDTIIVRNPAFRKKSYVCPLFCVNQKARVRNIRAHGLRGWRKLPLAI